MFGGRREGPELDLNAEGGRVKPLDLDPDGGRIRRRQGGPGWSRAEKLQFSHDLRKTYGHAGRNGVITPWRRGCVQPASRVQIGAAAAGADDLSGAGWVAAAGCSARHTTAPKLRAVLGLPNIPTKPSSRAFASVITPL